MSEAIKPQCLLGHGECPPECPNHEAARKITEKLGKEFNPSISRINVVFGDANQGVNLLDVCNIWGGCSKERLFEGQRSS